jgi:hypothetical protein
MWRRLSMLWGFWPALVLLVAVVSAGSVWIWQSGIRDQVEDLRSERFRFSLLHVKSVLEAGLRLGNTTADLPGAEGLIQAVRDRQPDILSIDIYDAQGDVLFSTDPGGLGLKLPAAWSQACLRTDGGNPWTDQDADGGVQCVGLVNAFGQAAGGVLLRHRWSAGAAQGLTLPTDWPLLAAAVAALVLVTGVAGAALVRPLEAQARQLRSLVESDGATQAAPDVTNEWGPASAALQALATQDRWLSDTDAEADQLDRQEAT